MNAARKNTGFLSGISIHQSGGAGGQGGGGARVLKKSLMLPASKTFPALHLVNIFAQVEDSEDLLDLTEHYLTPYEVKAMVFTKVPEPGESLQDVLLGIRWPPEFTKFYVDQKFEQDDPVFEQCRRAMFPFFWNAKRTVHEAGVRGKQIMELAHEMGLMSGLCIPVRGPDNYLGCAQLSFGEIYHHHDFTPRLENIALHAYRRLLEIHHSTLVERPMLTQRELQVLRHVANGLPAHEIASRLTITKRTVDEHVKHATRKLGALNRTNAVAIALRDGLIHLNSGS